MLDHLCDLTFYRNYFSQTEEVTDSFGGIGRSEALERASEIGVKSIRVIPLGEPVALLGDLRRDRLNLITEANVVVAAYLG
jgi:hypothetical protein